MISGLENVAMATEPGRKSAKERTVIQTSESPDCVGILTVCNKYLHGPPFCILSITWPKGQDYDSGF